MSRRPDRVPCPKTRGAAEQARSDEVRAETNSGMLDRDEEAIAASLAEYRTAGADHIAIQVLAGAGTADPPSRSTSYGASRPRC